jgi:hypothetical protein
MPPMQAIDGDYDLLVVHMADPRRNSSGGGMLIARPSVSIFCGGEARPETVKVRTSERRVIGLIPPGSDARFMGMFRPIRFVINLTGLRGSCPLLL